MISKNKISTVTNKTYQAVITNNLALNVNKYNIDSSGNTSIAGLVGMGTTYSSGKNLLVYADGTSNLTQLQNLDTAGGTGASTQLLMLTGSSASNPQLTLQLNGRSFTSTPGDVTFTASSGCGDFVFTNSAAKPFTFNINSSQAMKLDSGGNLSVAGIVGMGTAYSSGKNLLVYADGTTTLEQIQNLDTSGGTGASTQWVLLTGSSASNPQLTVQLNGRAFTSTPGQVNFTASAGCGDFVFTNSAAKAFTFNSNSVEIMKLNSNGRLALGAAIATPSYDISFDGGADATIGVEAASATNAGRTLSVYASDATSGGSNLNGGTLALYPGRSTGTAKAQIVAYRTTQAAATGTAYNTYTDAMTIVHEIDNFPNNVATGIFDMNMATLTSAAMTVSYGVDSYASGGTPQLASTSGIIYPVAQNLAGTIVVAATPVGQVSSIVSAGGTAPTVTWSVVAGTAKATVRLLYRNRGTTPFSTKICMTIFNNSPATITMLL